MPAGQPDGTGGAARHTCLDVAAAHLVPDLPTNSLRSRSPRSRTVPRRDTLGRRHPRPRPALRQATLGLPWLSR